MASLVVLAACHLEPSIPAARPACFTGDANPDLPIALIIEHGGWSNRTFPDLVLWGDGVAAVDGAYRVQLTPQHVHWFAHEAAEDLRGVSLYTSLTDETDNDDVEIAVRDDTTWHIATVYGVSMSNVDRAPSGFVAAFKRLRAIHSTAKQLYHPEWIRIQISRGSDAPGKPLEWPADVPEPPAQALDAHEVYEFMVPGTYDAAVAHLRDQSHGHPIVVGGVPSYIHVEPRFRGADAMDRVLDCAISLEQYGQ